MYLLQSYVLWLITYVYMCTNSAVENFLKLLQNFQEVNNFKMQV